MLIYVYRTHKCLDNTRKCALCLFADDANLKISGNSSEEIQSTIYRETINVQQYFKNLNLQLNFNKTKYLEFKTKQNRSKSDFQVEIGNMSIEKVHHAKFLGLTIDSNLSWDEHIRILLKKLNSGLFALRRMSHLCNLPALKLIYFSYIHSHIAYGISVYGASKEGNLYEILKTQKQALRIMLNLDYGESVKKYFKELRIMTVFSLYIYETIIYIKMHAPDNINYINNHATQLFY